MRIWVALRELTFQGRREVCVNAEDGPLSGRNCSNSLVIQDYDMAKKIQIGDIIEIPTSRGFSYAQLSHKHTRYGTLIRVLPGFSKSRPNDFAEWVGRTEVFVTFFPVQAAVNQRIFEVVDNRAVPDSAQSFPLFRTGVEDPVTRKVKVWWLWDGEKEWKVGDITTDQRKLPLRGIWNDTLLIERIEGDWTPSNDPS